MISTLSLFRRFSALSRPGRANWQEATDEELALAGRIHDKPGKAAFVEIVRRHQMTVCAVAFSVTGRVGLADDIAQEVFLKAWKRLGTLREPAKLKAWLSRIARDCAVDALRREKPHVPLDDDMAKAAASEGAPPDLAAAGAEDEELVWSSLSALPESVRTPLVLFYREGQSIAAVAAALELSEDAVRQRLSRGRQELREHVAAKIEGVLSRARPAAVFTMIIAAAIGAITAPAAMAGSAFTAAAAAGTGAASASVSTTGSAVTVMSTSKTLAATATIVAAACLPLGYGARMGVEPEAPAVLAAPVAKPAAAPAPPPAVKKEPDFSSSAMFAEWRELHEVHGHTPEAMPLLYKAIAGIKDPVRRRAFRAAQIAEWAEIAPAEGFAFFTGRNSDWAQREQFFDEWLRHDPSAAVTAAMGAGKNWEGVLRDSLPDIAKKLPGKVAELASRLPKSDSYWNNKVLDAFAIVAEKGLDSARAAAEAVEGPNREQALAGVAQAWAKSDPDAAIAWAKALPEGVDRDEIIRGALIGMSALKPTEALSRVSSVPPGGKQGYFAVTTGARVLKEAAAADYDATIKWLADNPSVMGREDLMGMANVVTDRLNADPVAFLKKHLDDGSLKALLPAIGSALLNEGGGQRMAVWEWLKSQPEGEIKEALRHDIFNSAGWQDPDLALRLVADIPAGREGDEMVGRIASSLLNGGSMLSRLDGLLKEVPARLKEPLLESAFNFLQPQYFHDSQKWLGYLSELPTDKQAVFHSRLASVWVQQDPEAAVAWISALPEKGRADAFYTTAREWAQKDPYDASEWISSLPAGEDRNRAAFALVNAIARDSPEDAWEWTLSLPESKDRINAAASVLRVMQQRDAGAASQWIDNAPFPEAEKEQFRSLMEAGAASAKPTPTE